MTNDRLLYAKAVVVFGKEHQMRKAMEECGELIAAINQYADGRISEEAIASEIADVEIMCAQLRLIVGSIVVKEQKAKKLNRLIARIGRETKKTERK